MDETLKPEKQEISFEQLQDFFNSPDLDLPERRRDLSDPLNLGWLNRNALIRNSEKIPGEMWNAFRKLYMEEIKKRQ